MEKIQNRNNKSIKNRSKKLFLVIAILIIGIACFSGCTQQKQNMITVSGAYSLYPMMVVWAEEYQKTHPDVKIDVSSGGAGKGMNDALSGSVNIGMVSRDITSSEVSQGIVYVSVVKDAVLATMSTDNPYLSNITKTGITKEQFREIFINHTITTWGQLINDSSVTTLIKVYSRSDICGAAETWAKYLGNYTQDDFPTAEWLTKLKGDDLMATTVKGDPNGIGYSNVNYIYDTTTKLPLDKLIPVPIDINGNGTIDPEENFYTNRDNVVTAEINGALPSPPTRVINLVTKGNFTGATNDFVYWILTAGQDLVFENGYSPLSDTVIQEQIAILGR